MRAALADPDYTPDMSHLDELDEFEAELELQLKREYTAVFPLFRYCVLTQDATYLCNTLDLKVVPQASYPFFHAQMEDVWVWDKNRPTRIIPRAEVYTSGDVTIEELRGEDDEPRLTAEALAERIGEYAARTTTTRTDLVPQGRFRRSGIRPRDPRLRRGRSLKASAGAAATAPQCLCKRVERHTWSHGAPSLLGSGCGYARAVLLAVDVGNTQTVLGLYDGEQLTDHWRLATDRTRTGDELSVLLGGLLDPERVDGDLPLDDGADAPARVGAAGERWAHAPLLAVGPGIRTGIPIRYDDPREVGARPDRRTPSRRRSGSARR